MTNGQSQVRIRDTIYNFQKHIELTDTVAKSYVGAVSNKVGMIDDMRKIVICGGGASFMKKHVQAMFGSDGLVMPSDSREAIAKVGVCLNRRRKRTRKTHWPRMTSGYG
jgi:hypothetical protein